ncbi:MAG: IS200/IS605 family transposase [Chloroflexi bacterium]|nr:IS200/IS605 family transposase [Chloroflexota bacterium]
MSFWRTYYHLVWTTKNRETLIQPEVEKRLYAYMTAKAAELGVYVYAINGTSDHIHLVVSIPPKHAIADVVQRLKGASSHDLGTQGIAFEWQRGYGVLTMGEKQRPVAEAYVNHQKTHHAALTTIAALEYCAELDEGPRDTGMTPAVVPAIVHDTSPCYDVAGELPF